MADVQTPAMGQLPIHSSNDDKKTVVPQVITPKPASGAATGDDKMRQQLQEQIAILQSKLEETRTEQANAQHHQAATTLPCLSTLQSSPAPDEITRVHSSAQTFVFV